MVNHVRTLLLNRNSETAERLGCWYVDPSFVPMPYDAVTDPVMERLFEESESDEDRVRMVDFCMSFLLAPEFGEVFGFFDTRTTCAGDTDRVRPSSVAKFFRSMYPGFDTGAVERVLSYDRVSTVFQHVGDARRDDLLDRLALVYGGSFETWRAFTAVMYAVVVRMDAAMGRSA